MKIGVLAVQGDFDAHRAMLERLGAETVLVKTPRDLEGLDGLVLPGGESTTHLKFLLEEGLFEPIRALGLRGQAMLGTCAGAILLAREVKNPGQPSLGLLDVVIERNAYGRQLASEVSAGPSVLRAEPLEMVYIRAPVIEQVGPGVEVLARRDGAPVLVRQGSILAATFHPELTSDTTVHELFLKLAGEQTSPDPENHIGGAGSPEASPPPADFEPVHAPLGSSAPPSAPRPAAAKPKRVLFVCVGNSCRSQMAEALARALASDVIAPSSAGLSPLGEIAEPTRRILLERGVSLQGQYSKGLVETGWRDADLIVNMTGIPGEALFGPPAARGGRPVLDWEIEDPFGEEQGIYRQVAEEIEEKIRELAETLRAPAYRPVERAERPARHGGRGRKRK